MEGKEEAISTVWRIQEQAERERKEMIAWWRRQRAERAEQELEQEGQVLACHRCHHRRRRRSRQTAGRP